jgi:PAS domain S-box-containing protein
MPATAPCRLVRARIGELEAIIDLASDGVVTLDGEGEIKDLNQAAQALVGYAAEDLIGRPFRLLFPEDSRQTALDYLEDIAGQGPLVAVQRRPRAGMHHRPGRAGPGVHDAWPPDR